MEAGFGLVSGDDLTTSRDRITVNTNTAGNPEFELWAGSGGPMNVTWTQLSGWSSRYSIQNAVPGGQLLEPFARDVDTAPAMAEGTVLGVRLPPAAPMPRWGP